MTNQPDSILEQKPPIQLTPIIKEEIKIEYDDRKREDTHASDLTLCLRKQVQHRLKPAELTNLDMRNFMTGKSHELGFALLIKRGLEKRGYKTKQDLSKTKDGIIGHIDIAIIDGERIYPVECKTTRQGDALPSDHYITQCKIYMCIWNEDWGCVFVESYNAQQEEKVWSENWYHMTKEERETFWKSVLEKKAEFETALNNKDWLQAPGAMYNEKTIWQCHRKQWKSGKILKECPYKQECWMHEVKSGRASVTSENNQLISIENSKAEKKNVSQL